jgi:hypothetical protein
MILTLENSSLYLFNLNFRYSHAVWIPRFPASRCLRGFSQTTPLH